MNCSGEAVEQFVNDRIVDNFKHEDLIVIHDDLDLPLGKVKIKRKSGHGGHKGIISIINYLQTNDFFRIKIGIGKPENKNITDHVLGKFNKEESEVIEASINKASYYSILLAFYKNIGKVCNIL
jgi:PTH1 family peptidyl-tRNA hydrolase